LDTNVWLCAITGSPDRVTRSTNYGSTWTTIVSQNFSNYGQPLEMDQNNPSTYYFAPDGGGFYRSTDNGASFTEISNNYPFRSPCDIIVMYDSSNVVFVGDGVTGSGQAKIFKSTNGGYNWSDMYTVTSSETPSLCNSAFDQSVAYSTEWSGSGFYKTTNYGNNWFLAGTTGTSGWGSDMCHEDPTVVLKGTYGSPAYLTTNSGISFVSATLGGGCGAGIMVPERGYLIAMQCSGLFKMNISYSVITDISENLNTAGIPDNFTLYQNYPNPFNPSTNIKFDLPVPGNVTLKVYNQTGNEISTLTGGYRNAGSYEISFNASELSSGIYFYTLTANGASVSKKMLLIK
ncbi:MAG: T9SS type A sorting domain-containing protein, partial [Ignavibacteria bacterium]|nr:T9SS type A sorting domain-containing protein [Ignavibacteria bacterium]